MGPEATRGAGNPAATGEERFSLTTARRADAVVLTLSGELDHDTAGPLREALERHVGQGARRILVDFGPLRFCDSTGLNVLLHARLAAQEAGGRIELAALRPPVARMFEITGAQAVFQVYAGVEEALADERPA
ncbi:STAS domain-containing protein [Streptomyces sp. ISL-10]|uniref:STAS domain-containing protein n=1 Tax=Streptomyces sp. ISL-10 TaxID=2819172 RepID=UPI001BE7E64F|nr:STAS domain-containing protein [Streptomyces sp. ISL-10]MBT2366074.1 STAS domain-containing protein [Streptomyces sp. ISL-10]